MDHDPARAVDHGERLELVGLAVAIGVSAADDLAATFLAVERPVLVDADVDRAIRRRGETDRITHVGRCGEQRNLKAGRSLDPAEQPRPSDAAWLEIAAARDRSFLELRPVNFKLEKAAPMSGSKLRRGETNVPHVLRRELQRLSLLARLALRLVRQHRPRLAITRTFDLVAVVRVVRFPLHGDARQFLSLAQINLPPLTGVVVRRTPSRRFVPVDCVFGRMTVL